MATEADTCRTFVLPKLYAAGWTDEQICEQRTFTDGRIVVAGNKAWRRPRKRTDYLLCYHRRNYTKTAPVQFEEFADLIASWGQREETERAWKVPAAELLANGGNLDRRNPRAKADITHLPPEQLAASILEKEQRIAAILGRIRELLEKRP
jgi:hypothetical protein